jgi:hypothetical protein
MNDKISVTELKKRWAHVLTATGKAAAAHPATYGELKTIAAAIVDEPLDIKEYFPTVEKLAQLLHNLDPCGSGSIFDLFCDRFSPRTIWQVQLLRVECKDLLAHLHDFDQWRRKTRHLRVVK